MTSGTHLDDDILSAFLDGELADGEARSFLAHQAGCESCRARLQAFGRVSRLVAAAPQGLTAPGVEPYDDQAGRILTAALAEADPVPPRARRRAWQGVASVAAVLVGVAIILGLFGHSTAPIASSKGLNSSLGTFSNARELSATLATEIASLAPNPSAPVLPCQPKAAATAAQPADTSPIFSSPLVYSGVKAEVFVYQRSQGRTSGARHPAKVAVVVRDGDCSFVAYLTW